jgi:hypothetical protein
VDDVKMIPMVFMGQCKDIPEYDVEDALCSGWLLDGDEAMAAVEAEPWTVARLKERLGELGISIPRGATKDEMIALLPEAER